MISYFVFNSYYKEIVKEIVKTKNIHLHHLLY